MPHRTMYATSWFTPTAFPCLTTLCMPLLGSHPQFPHASPPNVCHFLVHTQLPHASPHYVCHFLVHTHSCPVPHHTMYATSWFTPTASPCLTTLCMPLLGLHPQHFHASPHYVCHFLVHTHSFPMSHHTMYATSWFTHSFSMPHHTMYATSWFTLAASPCLTALCMPLLFLNFSNYLLLTFKTPLTG